MPTPAAEVRRGRCVAPLVSIGTEPVLRIRMERTSAGHATDVAWEGGASRTAHIAPKVRGPRKI